MCFLTFKQFQWFSKIRSYEFWDLTDTYRRVFPSTRALVHWTHKNPRTHIELSTYSFQAC